MRQEQGYDTVDELVAAATNGYVVLGMSTRPGTVPAVYGPYATKEEARRAQARLRHRWREEEAPFQVRLFVRMLWKDLGTAR